MSSLFKNTAGQKWRVFAFTLATNEPVTGDSAQITAKISLDWGTATAITDTNPTETEDGFYDFTLTQAETNAVYEAGIFPESSTSGVQVIGVPAVKGIAPAGFSTLPTSSDLASATATAVWSALLASHTTTATMGAAMNAITTYATSGSASVEGPTAATELTDIPESVFAGGTVGLFARVRAWDGDDITAADISSITYTIYLLDDSDPTSATVVTGHSAVTLTKTAVIYDTLQTDAWASDYNFKHVPPINANAAFATAGRSYRVEYTITPVLGEKIKARFKVMAL